MSPPLCPSTLSSAPGTTQPRPHPNPPAPSQASLLCVHQLMGLSGRRCPSSSPRSEGQLLLGAQTGAGLPPPLLRFLALLRHVWELCGAPYGWQWVCWTSSRPQPYSERPAWAWSSGPFSADLLGHTWVSASDPHLSWPLPRSPGSGDPSGLKRVVAGARACSSWKPCACVCLREFKSLSVLACLFLCLCVCHGSQGHGSPNWGH